MTLRGTIIAESIRPGAHLNCEQLRVVRINRWDLEGRSSSDQPGFWTAIDFEAEDPAADDIARAIADVINPDGGWYCDFRVGDDQVIIYAGEVFRYPHGNKAGRARAVAHGVAVGVPEHQLDWDG